MNKFILILQISYVIDFLPQIPLFPATGQRRTRGEGNYVQKKKKQKTKAQNPSPPVRAARCYEAGEGLRVKSSSQ